MDLIIVDIDFVNAVTPVETRLVCLIECLLTQWRHVLSDNTDKASCVSLITFNRSRALSSYQPVVFRHNTGVVKISEFLANTSLSHLSAVICVLYNYANRVMLLRTAYLACRAPRLALR